MSTGSPSVHGLVLSSAVAVVLGSGCTGELAVPSGTDGVPSPADAPAVCSPASVVLTGMIDSADLLPAGVPPEDQPFEKGPGIALGDLDGDGWTDAVVALPLGGSRFLHNDGTGHLVLDPGWTVDGGPVPVASAVAVADLDSDGDQDVVLSRASGLEDLVLYNLGQGDFTAEALPDSEPESLTVTVADFDGDGRLDLFVAGFQSPETRGHTAGGPTTLEGEGQRLYLQDSEGAFDDASDRLPTQVDQALTFQGAPMDADGDGDLDLYLVNDHVAEAVPNTLLRNDGHGHFTVAEDASCAVGSAPMGAGVGDLNRDGLPDLYVSDLETQHLLLNASDGAFIAVGQAYGAVDNTSKPTWGAVIADVDLDGLQDLLMARGGVPPQGLAEGVDQTAEGLLLRATALGSYEELDPHGDFNLPRQGRSVVVGDLDRDGRPELVTAGLWSVETWDIDGGCNGIALRLEGGVAIGAQVRVRHGDQDQTTWLLPSTSFSMSEQVVMVGLGTDAVADEVVVTWPDGFTQVLEQVPAGSQILLTRDPVL